MAALMIAVPEETSRILQEIPVEGKREQHSHITVIHLGKDVPIERISEMLPLLYEVTSKTLPFSVSTNWVSSFPAGDDGTPVICRVFSPELHDFRDALKAKLDAAKMPYSNNYPEYKPHVTLAYDPDPEAHYDGEIPEISWGAHELLLWGSNRGTGRLVIKFPLSLPGVKVASQPDALKRAAVKLSQWSKKDSLV
jgi:2'-5' RNA ligase